MTGAYKLRLTTATGVKNYPIMANGFALDFKVGAIGKHASSSCRLSIRGSAALQDIITGNELIEAKVIDSNAVTLFSGVIRPYLSVSAAPMQLENLQVEILDYTEKLHVKVYAKSDTDITADNAVWEDSYDNFKVCDPDDEEHSLIHKLAGLCGIYNIEAPAIDVTIHRFSLEYGDYIDDVLSTLLYEYIHDYRFDENGKMIVFQTGTITEISGDETISHELTAEKTISSFINSLEISRSDDNDNGVVVSYSKYKEKADVLIYSETISGWSPILDISTGWAAASNKEVRWDLSQIEETDSGYDIQLSNFRIEGKNTSKWLASTWGTQSLGECDNEIGHISYDLGCAGGLGGRLSYAIKVYADVSYLKKDSRTVGYSGLNAREYSAKYIEELEYAASLATAIRNQNLQSRYTYTFSSFEKMQPGVIVNLVESELIGVYTKVRILSREESDATGLYKYQAEGYDTAAFTAPTINKDDDISSTEEALINFFTIEVSRDSISSAEEDDTKIVAVVSGTILSQGNAVLSWKLNDVPLSGSSAVMNLTKAQLQNGSNIIECTAVVGEDTYTVRDRVLLMTATAKMLKLVASGLIFSADSEGTYKDGQYIVLTAYATSITAPVKWDIPEKTISDGTASVTVYPQDLIDGSLAVSISAEGFKDSALITTVYDGAQGPQGEKGETGAQGPQGNKGDAGIDGDSLSLSVVSASDRFTLSWIGNPSPESQTIELEAFSRYIAAENITWACSEGELSAVSGNAYRRTLSISSISDDALSSGASIKIQVSGVTAQGTSLVSTLFISIIKADNPVPIYCGKVDLSSDSVTNTARQEGIYAPGDYVFYSGNSNDDYIYGNIYAWNGSSWEMDNSSSHTFGALEDLVDTADAGADTTPFQIISNLIVSRLVGDYLTIRNANIKEKLTVDKISGKDENGIGFELSKDGISATRKDENGNIVSSWEFRSDGSGSIFNLDVLGKLVASAINHEALITQSATAFGESGQKSYQKDFPKDLWSRSKMHQRIVAAGSYSDSVIRTMTSVSGASYGGKTIAKIGFARSSLLPDNVLSNTEAETEGSLQFGIYKRSYGVSAGSRHTKLAKKTNNFGFPVYVDAAWSLSGNWNWQEMYIYDSDGKGVYSNNSEDNGSYHNCFILPPGYSFKITAGSTAWWGNRTASFTVKVSPCPMVPYISEGALTDITQTASSSVSGMQYWTIGTVAAPASARYIAFFYNKNRNPCSVFRISNGSDNAEVYLTQAPKLYEDGPIYMEIPDSLRGKTLTIEAGASRSSSESDSGTSYYNYTCYMKLVHYALFSYLPDSRDSIILEYADGTAEKLDCSYPLADYRDWDINRFIYSSYDSAAYLEKISGTTVCSWLDGNGFTQGAQFSSDQGEDSVLTIDTDSYGVSQGTRLISIQKISSGYQIMCDGATVNVYQLDGAASASFGFYDTLSLLFYPLASESKILTRNIEPQQNITFDIGTLEKMFRHIYAQGMTLGEEGEDWLIEDNEGYVTLPGGVVIEWGLSPAGRYTGGEFDTRKIIFPKPMKYPAFWGFSSQIAGNNRDGYYYGYLSTSKAAEGTGTALAADYMCITAWNGYDYRWIAIGEV